VPTTCMATINAFGGLAGASTQRAAGIATCVATSACGC
jgi:hypothetical protein